MILVIVIALPQRFLNLHDNEPASTSQPSPR